MWRKIIAGLALFAIFATAAEAASHRGGQRILLLEKTSAVVAPAPPAWLNGAQIGANFAANQYYVAGTGLVPYNSILTLTRASNETCLDSLGNVTYVGNNTPCVTDIGWQSTWESRQNLLLNSGDLSNASWATFANNSGTISRTGNAATAPDGTTTAAAFTINRTATNAFAQVNQTFSCTAANYTGSIWLKAQSSADLYKNITITLYNGTIPVGTIRTALTSSWVRYSTVGLLVSGAGCQFVIGYFTGIGSDIGVLNFYAWGGQVELGNTPSPYIPNTTVATTRAADVITATGALATQLASATGSIAAWTNSDDAGGLAKTLVDTNGAVLLGVNTSNQATTALGATLATSNAAVWTGVNNLGFSWNASGGLFDLIGTISSDATARTPAAPFRVGSTAGTSNFWNGNLGTMLFYNTKQSTPQVALPAGVTPGFINRYSWSTLPGAVQYRSFAGMIAANGGSALYAQNQGSYDTLGTNTPYLSSTSRISGTYNALSSTTSVTHSAWKALALYQTSTNPGTGWTANGGNPILTATAGTTTDDNYLLHPTTTTSCTNVAPYVTFYSAMTSTSHWNIWAATSSNFTSWSKVGTPAIFFSQNANAPNPGLPSTITIGSTVYMYTVTNGNLGNQIALWSSPTTDCVNWTYVGNALAAPVSGDWDFGASIIDIWVIKNKQGWYEMTYTAFFTAFNFQQIGYAISSDGITFYKYTPAPIMTSAGANNVGDTVLFQDYVNSPNNMFVIYNIDNSTTSSVPFANTLPPY